MRFLPVAKLRRLRGHDSPPLFQLGHEDHQTHISRERRHLPAYNSMSHPDLAIFVGGSRFCLSVHNGDTEMLVIRGEEDRPRPRQKGSSQERRNIVRNHRQAGERDAEHFQGRVPRRRCRLAVYLGLTA